MRNKYQKRKPHQHKNKHKKHVIQRQSKNREILLELNVEKQVFVKPEIEIPKQRAPETDIEKHIDGMSRTEAYKETIYICKKYNIPARKYRDIVQEFIPLSKRYYECLALQLPDRVSVPKHVGKKKKQEAEGLRTSKSGTPFSVTDLYKRYESGSNKGKLIKGSLLKRINKVKQKINTCQT